PARPDDPYGVAELFRQCLTQASAFRQRQLRAHRRLFWTVAGAAGLVGAMLLLILAFLFIKPNPLANRVPIKDNRASVRLAGTLEEVEGRLRDLQDLQSDPRYTTLPRGDRDYVNALEKEMELYVLFWEKLRQQPALDELHTDKDLD